MSKVSKRMAASVGMIEAGRLYSLDEAVALVEKLPSTKFDESIDVAILLGVDPRKAEENVRGVVALPHGTGKTIRVAAFCLGDKMKEAQEAGADFVGAEDLVAKVSSGWLDFDAAVATPDMMVQIGKIGKLLGPRGLMPNPKTGSVTFDIGKAVKAIKGGRVEYRVDKASNLHVGVGRKSFGSQRLGENMRALIDAVVKAKPKTSKGVYLEQIFVSSTMGPSIAIDPMPFRTA